jgi:HPt (histidine-containing phosphotransfer) domain-containing protein
MTREGNPALTPPVVAELRDKVCADLAAQTEKIQAAFVARDVNSVARLARKMQSSADIFGLQRIAREARFVWANAGKDCQLEQLQASVAVLKELCRSAVSPVSSEEPGDAVFNVTSTPGRG